jgi:hypothetical protein
VQKSKKEKPELEEEMRAAKEKYEVTMEDINNKMFALNDSEVCCFFLILRREVFKN